MTELHPTPSGAELPGLLLAEKRLPYPCTLLSPGRSKSSVLQGHPDSDLRAGAAFESWTRAGFCPQAGRCGPVGPPSASGHLAVRPGSLRPGSWRSGACWG